MHTEVQKIVCWPKQDEKKFKNAEYFGVTPSKPTYLPTKTYLLHHQKADVE